MERIINNEFKKIYVIVNWWKKLKYWQKSGIISIILVLILFLLLGLSSLISNWNNVYRNGEFYCPDFKGVNWTPCSFFNAISGQVFTPIVFLFGFPIIIFAFLEIPIKSNFGIYLLMIVSLLIGASFYFGVGAFVAFIICKIKKKRL